MRTAARWISLCAIAVGLLAGPALARDDRAVGLPAEQLIAAIRTAVAAHPGTVSEVEVERERGRTLVEVKILDDVGERRVKVDPERNEVVRTGS